MDSAALARRRMHAQLVWAPASSPEDVIRHLAACQGQDYLPATWSIAQRCQDVPERAVVDAALDEGRILRTHTLRPTWHLVAPEALPWLLAATTPRVHQANKHYYRQVGVDAALMTVARRALEKLLADRHATREDVAVALSAAGVEATGVRLAYVLMWAEIEGWIVSGRRSGRHQTYALYDERVPDASAWSRDDGLGRLAEVYFGSRGPATLKDLARWASLTLDEARRACEAAGSAVEELDAGGRTYLVGAGQSPAPAGASRVDLLQQYDELAMSFSESRDVQSGGRRWELGPPSTLVHTILLDGGLVGHWRYTRDGTGRPDAVETSFYDAPVGPPLLDDAVRRFATFAGGPVEHRFV